MPTVRFAANQDLPEWAIWITAIFAVVSAAALLLEVRRGERRRAIVLGTGLLALAALVLAILRPVRVRANESTIGPRVIVLSDVSRSMDLADTGRLTRAQRRDAALTALKEHWSGARLSEARFADGLVAKDAPSDGSRARGDRRSASNLADAISELTDSGEPPAAIAVISDGRWTAPSDDATDGELASLAQSARVPIHMVSTTSVEPRDASVRRVEVAQAAVAHVPLPLRVHVGCNKGLDCDKLTVTVREFREDSAPALLASGVAELHDGEAVVDFTVTLERAGARILEVSVEPPSGDTIPENDRRLITLQVKRDRVRVLHVAGRPTQDVRALRQWLKSDAAVDVIAFFILRTPSDNPLASQDELALIPFPVDELFTDHLPSFDAVILQDFDAQPYGLERHLPALARYVRAGGGLIMVGGPNSFVSGGYAGSALANVLPIEMDTSAGATSADAGPFIPRWTRAGTKSPLLEPLRSVVGEELPEMPGTNVVGDLRPGALALWTHPVRRTRTGKAMPVLSIADQGDGRAIALTIDGGWRFAFSAIGAKSAGRGHAALWDGLLGWLMRDPRFEPLRIDVPAGCVIDDITRVAINATWTDDPPAVAWELRRLDGSREPIRRGQTKPGAGQGIALAKLEPGAYSLRAKVADGPATRHDFACEAGGAEWADSRPDPGRMRRLAEASGGTFSTSDNPADIPLPPPTRVSTERHAVPVSPPWAWSTLAAMLLGAHWILRRRGGLA